MWWMINQFQAHVVTEFSPSNFDVIQSYIRFVICDILLNAGLHSLF